MANFSRTDLDFVFQQILTSEADSAQQIGGVFDVLPTLVTDPLLPYGMRNVNGSFNNLITGQYLFGAADQAFPRLLQPTFQNAGPVTFDVDGPGPVEVGDPTSYTQFSGAVFDTHPRVISNLIVDQTSNNPAAVAAAAQNAGSETNVDGKGTFFLPNVTPDAGLSPPYNSWFTLFGQFFDHGLDLVNKGNSGTVFIPLEADDPLIPGPDGFLGDNPITVIDESADDSSGNEAFFGDDPLTTEFDESLDDSPGADLAVFGDDPTTLLVDESEDDSPGADGFYGDNPNTPADESADDNPGALLAQFGDNPTTFINESLDDLPAHLRFMAMTRVTNQPGPNGILGDSDDVRDNINQTTPFVDQNQTYTSHPSHQVFLREYELNINGRPVATGKLLENSTTGDGLATWADIKAQAQTMLGINLTDADLTNLPLLRTDTYGKFIPGPNGFAQIITGLGPDGVPNTPDDIVVVGNPAANGGLGVSTANAIRTGHAFLDDIAHTAVPKFAGGVLNPDADTDTGNTPSSGTYDNELLDAHFITGDGRGNENIGLTTVHTVFHAEHNRTVDSVKALISGSGDQAFIDQWHLPDGSWNGERLFQAARFATEMQYQHLVFEEFARKVQPNVNAFINYDSTIDPAIMAEFAHVVYRFGHSMLTETVARTNADGSPNDIGLIEAFLNPVAFGAGYANNIEAAGAVVNGMTKQVGNEIDEFVTGALRNNLVGLPLDLATINLVRGRDTGMASLNEARQMFYEDTGGNSALLPYESWADFGFALRHPESLVNFVAAYGNHPSITAATTLADKRLAAEALVNGTDQDAIDFMNGPAASTGMNDVDFWIGGLAEQQSPFGGLLGSTFNFVFQTQMESLQDGDRFYYLARTAGLDFLTELEQNSFSELIMRNLPDVKHLPLDSFSTPTYTFELSAQNPSGAIINDPDTPYDEKALLARDNSLGANTIRYSGLEHIVMGGTEGNDRIRGGGGIDTIWGDGGNDRLEGGGDNDSIIGGAGNDIITDSFGDDIIKGGDGHDFINAGPGLNLILAGAGSDFVVTGNDISEVFAGPDNDFIFGNKANAAMIGNTGNDWIQYGTAGGAVGDNNDPLNLDAVRGNDVFVGSGGLDDFRGEGGDDIMNGLAGPDRNDGASGFDWATNDDSTLPVDFDLARLVLPINVNFDRFNFVEGASGGSANDILRGDDSTFLELELIDPITGQNNALDNVNMLPNGTHSAADRIAQINGLQALLNLTDPFSVVSTFSAGNILLGGAGSDLIEGRAGDDIIDGDAYLNTRIVNTATNINYPNMTSALRSLMQTGNFTPDQLTVVREILTTPAGSAIDTAVYQDVFANYTLTFSTTTGALYLEHVPLANGGGAGNDDGVDTLRNIERLQFADLTAYLGTTGDDNLTGTAANEVLLGLSGNDTLNGLGGVDVLVGGTGNDTYVIDTNTDTITELNAQGTDTVQSAVTFTLAFNLENLTLTGSNPINGTGNSVNNILIGNTGNNTLNGLGGNDTLDGFGGTDSLNGGAGNDIYIINAATVTYTEAAGGGIDTIRTSVTLAPLAANFEHLTLTGSSAINGTGNTVANIITGNSNNNILNGLGGIDTLIGGDGDDQLIGDAGADALTGGLGADIFVYSNSLFHSNGSTRDTITDFLSGTDKINLDAIDANGVGAGTPDFVWIGANAFTAPGQVRYAGGLLEANTAGTSTAEFQINLAGSPTLVVTDLLGVLIV
jgi:Ca2+-binding RTX toxin-like protein